MFNFDTFVLHNSVSTESACICYSCIDSSWFPGIEEKVKVTIENCIACQANGSYSKAAPLQMTTLPPHPWHTVNVDFAGPFPTGEYLLVVIDAYSRFSEVEIVHTTAARGTIGKLDRIFSTHGIPKVLKSDNGPPFSSTEFKVFVQERGIRHQKSTPLWPQANAEAENFMKPLTKTIRSAHVEGRDRKKFLYQFLLNYRATPHSTSGIAPAKLLFNRNITTKLPELVQPENTKLDTTVRARDAKAKQKMKDNADSKVREKENVVKIGDMVLVRQKKQNKFSTKFDPSPYRVTEVKGSMITALRDKKSITRNISHFKPVRSDTETPGAHDSDSSDDEQDIIDNAINPQASQPELISSRRYPTRNRNRCARYGQNIYDT
jgi:transposase InsO family protein